MTEEQKKKHQDYINRYNRENYDRIAVMLPKGTKEKFRALAVSNGHTLSSYIIELLFNALDESRKK